MCPRSSIEHAAYRLSRAGLLFTTIVVVEVEVVDKLELYVMSRLWSSANLFRHGQKRTLLALRMNILV